jgi:hypothetical protein
VPAGTALVVRDAAPLSLFGPAGAAEALAHVETYATTLREFVERHPEVGNSDTTPVGEQVCERCGGHYYPRGGRQRFCSAECRLKSGKSRPPNWLKPTGGPPLPAWPCAFWGCGRMFEPKHDRHAFCSPACRYGARRRDQSSRYGRGHRNRRAALEPIVALGRTPCARRRELILPEQVWDLDHAEDGTYLGPSHAACNRAAPMLKGRNRGETSHVTRTSREWCATGRSDLAGKSRPIAVSYLPADEEANSAGLCPRSELADACASFRARA